MTKELPPTFDEFSTEAKIDFLAEARSIHDMLYYLFELIDEEYENNNGGTIQKESLAILYVHLQESDQTETEDSV